MFGYMTAKDALANGFTHHGRYYGIPLWVTDEEIPMVATKWMPLELLMTVFHYIEGFVQMVMYPDVEPEFQFLIGPPIENS